MVSTVEEHLYQSDVLVIGGGIAGFFAAIKAKEKGAEVILVDKAYAGNSGATPRMTACMFLFDPKAGMDADTVKNAIWIHGEYINNLEWVDIAIKESLPVYQSLLSWGVEFPHGDFPPPFAQAVKLGYRKIGLGLRKFADKTGVKIIDRVMITDLARDYEKAVGATGFSLDTGQFYIFKSKTTVLAAGGNSFRPSGVPISSLTGDGEAIAYRHGLEIVGKEFVTTHPSLAGNIANKFPHPKRELGLLPYLSQFVNGEGKKYDGWRALEPDLSYDFIIHAGRGPIYWDFDSAAPEEIECRLDFNKVTFGSQRNYTAPSGKIRMAGGSYVGYRNVGCGGIWITDTNCATALKGLYAAGDCAATLINGARVSHPGLGSVPAAITGWRAGVAAAEYALHHSEPQLSGEEIKRLRETTLNPLNRKVGYEPRWVIQLVRNIMFPYYISHIKHEKRLQAALTLVEFLRDHFVPKLYARDSHELRLAHETKNMVLNAEMILRASLFRTESRGTHYREDYPQRRDPEWLAWTKIRDEKGEMKVYKEPVPREWWPDLSKPYEERYTIMFPGEKP